MNEQKLKIVTFEQARRMKALGFDWPCRESYENGELLSEDPLEWNYNAYEGVYSAPTVALALKWFRDVKNVQNGIQYVDTGMKLFYYGQHQSNGLGFFDKETAKFDTHEAAESALLDALLEQAEKEAE